VVIDENIHRLYGDQIMAVSPLHFSSTAFCGLADSTMLMLQQQCIGVLHVVLTVVAQLTVLTWQGTFTPAIPDTDKAALAPCSSPHIRRHCPAVLRPPWCGGPAAATAHL
jgi:hypothetical protein